MPLGQAAGDACEQQSSWFTKLRLTTSCCALFLGDAPVSSAHVVILLTPGQHGVLQATTWGNRGGCPAATRRNVGENTTQQERDSGWITTHEPVYMALASLPDSQRWFEEGIATYVEPMTRA